MCGFAGEVRFDARRPDVAAVAAMGRLLAHRGPDDEGLVNRDHFAVAHRRLAIIDPTPRSRQPWVDDALGLTLVYNGAIYNYRDLRRELEDAGYAFSSEGDTEVVVKAYHAWGEGCVTRFNGMFAFVILEHETGRLFAARDRFGIKPLYLAEIDGGRGLRFASTLPALTGVAGVDTEIDPVAVCQYLTLHAVVPAPRTILRGVRKLGPASFLVLERDGRRRVARYWELAIAPDDRPSLDDWAAEVLTTLRAAAERRMVADVPVGVLLSGGLDSSLIVALLHEAGHRTETFSIGFEAVRDEAGDEFAFSDLVSRRFETTHHRIAVDSDATLDVLPACIAAMAEPMISHDAVAFFLLGREVGKTLSAVQTGQGADEIFAGYHWYPRLVESAAPASTYATAVFDRTYEELRSIVGPAIATRDHAAELVEAHFDGLDPASAVDKALHLDTTVMLVDDPLKRVDNMTMAWGVEARVPFLDHELVELAARIPARYKLAGGGKHVLKTAARALLPAALVDRPKAYFPVPALTRLEGRFLELVGDTLGSARARARGLVDPTYVQMLLRSPDEHSTPLRGSKLWQLGVLEAWLQARGL